MRSPGLLTRLLFHAALALWGLAALTPGRAGAEDSEVKVKMRAALEALAPVPSEPPRFLAPPSELPRQRPDAPGDRSRAAPSEAQGHGQSSLKQANDEALVHAQGGPAGAGSSAVGVERSQAAKAKAHQHPHPPHP